MLITCSHQANSNCALIVNEHTKPSIWHNIISACSSIWRQHVVVGYTKEARVCVQRKLLRKHNIFAQIWGDYITAPLGTPRVARICKLNNSHIQIRRFHVWFCWKRLLQCAKKLNCFVICTCCVCSFCARAFGAKFNSACSLLASTQKKRYIRAP